jgi:hypothetical protein
VREMAIGRRPNRVTVPDLDLEFGLDLETFLLTLIKRDPIGKIKIAKREEMIQAQRFKG